MTDLATHLIGDRKIETVVTGIRPGEKIHEILVSEEEATRTVYGEDGYFAVRPMLPAKSVSPANNWLAPRWAGFAALAFAGATGSPENTASATPDLWHPRVRRRNLRLMSGTWSTSRKTARRSRASRKVS